MLIECPFCHAQANLPESKEGAKVRCPDCKKVYLARERGRRGKASSGPSGLQIGLIAGVAVAALVIVVMVTQSGKDKGTVVRAPPVTVAEPRPTEDFDGWNSAPVQVVRAIYDSALAGNEAGMTARMDARRYADWRVAEYALLAAAAAGAPTPGEELGAAPPSWAELDRAGRSELLVAAAQGWLEGQGDTVAVLWKPYDGRVISEDNEQAVVHLNVSGRSPELQAESRVIEWKLARDGDTWKVWAWGRYISPEEARASLARRDKQITLVKLDDGTKLFQADPRPLPHLPDTSPELAARIDAALARMLDFTLRPRENSSAEADLVAIGKPSLPALLTALYETKIVDDDTLSKAVKIHYCMRNISGYDPGFPVMAVGPDAEAKRAVAVRAWFAWWLRKGEKNFTEREDGPDLLDGLADPAQGGG